MNDGYSGEHPDEKCSFCEQEINFCCVKSQILVYFCYCSKTLTILTDKSDSLCIIQMFRRKIPENAKMGVRILEVSLGCEG